MTLLGCALVAGCARKAAVTVSDEPWHNEWQIVVNSNEPNLDKPGHHPMGWIPDELPPDRYVNRPFYEGAGKRKGLLALHPLSLKEPARIRFTGAVPLDRPVLTVEASGNVNGDCLLQCVVNGKKIGEYTLDGSKWAVCEFDLSRFVGEPMDIELWNAAGGKEPWHFEHCYIDTIYFKRK
jgi:hypothetical protein